MSVRWTLPPSYILTTRHDPMKNVNIGQIRIRVLLSQFVIFSCLFLISHINLIAQEDAYHEWLRDQLQSEYNINGGTWVIAETESDALNSVWSSPGVIAKEIEIPGKPFSMALRLETEDRPGNIWDYAAQFSTNTPIASGDALLLVVWVRGLSGERGQGFVTHNYELAEPPYSGSFAQQQAPSGIWQQLMFPIEAQTGMPSSWYKIHLGAQVQEVMIGGVAVLNFEDKYTVDELPMSTFHLDYDGREMDADWRAAAAERIEMHRKNDIRVHVVDNNGEPVKGAQVQVDMVDHAFGFGTSIYVPERAATIGQTAEELEIYYEKFHNLTGDGRGFNWAVIDDELRWNTWENPYWPPYQAEVGQNHTLTFIEDLLDHNIEVRGHMFVWPEFIWLPGDIGDNHDDPAYIRDRINNHITSMLNHPRLEGRLVDWNVINEPAHLKDLEEVFGDKEIYAEWFKVASDEDSSINYYVNEYDVISARGMNLNIQEEYAAIIETIDNNGGHVDGIGFECHMGYPLTPPELVYEIIDEYASMGNGKDISISEYDALGVDEFMAGEYMRDFLTIAFSHPAVKSFLMWGYWDANHWLGDAPLYREDFSLKPSGQAFIDLVFDQWWTNVSGESNSDGEFVDRGFLGAVPGNRIVRRDDRD